MIRATCFATPLGACAVAWTEGGIRCLRLPDGPTAAGRALLRQRVDEIVGTVQWAKPPRWVAKVVCRVQRHLGGHLDALDDVPLDLGGLSPFAVRTYRQLRVVEPGQTVSYGELARRIDCPRAARAVGRAMAHNRLPVLIPCHRVVTSTGRLGAFSAPGGVATKRHLLMIEGARVAASAARIS